ncbi:hypothetical protein MKX01_019311 [Papaver californicum]|nr:hypothetical protein MKX01_019311 [Papaver californicum]
MRTGSRKKVCICPVSALVARNRVENRFDETQMFIEVQIQGKKISRTNSDIQFQGDQLSFSPLAIRLFQINFADLFCFDIFFNCNLSPLLSMNNILGDHHSISKFWNMFLCSVSRFGNRAGNVGLKRNQGV